MVLYFLSDYNKAGNVGGLVEKTELVQLHLQVHSLSNADRIWI